MLYQTDFEGCKADPVAEPTVEGIVSMNKSNSLEESQWCGGVVEDTNIELTTEDLKRSSKGAWNNSWETILSRGKGRCS